MTYFEPWTSSGDRGGAQVKEDDGRWGGIEFTVSEGRTFQLPHDPIENSERVIYAGVTLSRGSNRDYTLEGATLYLSDSLSLIEGERLAISYEYDSKDTKLWGRYSDTYSSDTITLSHTPISGSIDVSISGVPMTQGADYTVSGDTVTLDGSLPAEAGMNVDIRYQYEG